MILNDIFYNLTVILLHEWSLLNIYSFSGSSVFETTVLKSVSIERDKTLMSTFLAASPDRKINNNS